MPSTTSRRPRGGPDKIIRHPKTPKRTAARPTGRATVQFCRSQQLDSVGNPAWAGWDSNPRPRDYEGAISRRRSAKQQVRVHSNARRVPWTGSAVLQFVARSHGQASDHPFGVLQPLHWSQPAIAPRCGLEDSMLKPGLGFGAWLMCSIARHITRSVLSGRPAHAKPWTTSWTRPGHVRTSADNVPANERSVSGHGGHQRCERPRRFGVPARPSA